MSDNSNSTGSSGSSANSWTLLSPEEAAVENVGPVDDGTESLGDVPSLSEEVAGAAMEFKPSDIPIETVLSEEGHQVCQETSPESSEGPVPSSPSRISPLPPNLLDPSDLDLESQPPIIHDIDTSSPSDNELLGAAPFAANIDYGAQLEILAAEPPAAELEEACCAPPMTASELELDAPADVGQDTAGPADETPLPAAEPKVSIVTETLTASDPPSCAQEDVTPITDITEPQGQVPEIPAAERSSEDSSAPETVGSAEAAEEGSTVQKEETQPAETVTQEEREEEEEEPSSSFHLDDSGGFDDNNDDGLRRRHVPPFEAPRPRTSDEEDEEEEAEFRLAERKEEKPWFSLNKCIVGALILLFLGSLFLSGDFDASELSDGEQSQDWLSGDPQDMKELLDKLTQENQQIAQLEAQLQSQKEELDAALTAVAASGDEKGKADLEKENTKLKEELSSLPDLKKELEGLRARVTELSQLTAVQEAPPAPPSSAPQPGIEDGHGKPGSAAPESRKGPSKAEGGKLKEELHRQKVLLEESGKRLQGMKKDGGDRRRLRDNLEEIQRKLSEQVDMWGKRKPQEGKWKGNKGKGKPNERDHWKKEDKREWKPSKEAERRDKDERKEKEWKSPKPNSHKESWRRHQDEWERKKGERRVDREQRRKEKPWHSRPAKTPHHHHQQQQQQQHQQPRKHNTNDFWRDQEQKLRRNVRALTGCGSVDDCAAKEGLYPVELPEFEELLEGYLSKLEGSPPEAKDRIRGLTAEFFEGSVFIHDRAAFSDFAEDVADILEDMVDVMEGDGRRRGGGGGGGGGGDDSLEEEMEEFEREALWKFAATS